MERFCCDDLCEQGKDCPVRNQARSDFDKAGFGVWENLSVQPSKPWFGLTEKEAAQCWNPNARENWKNIEAALKEKNT